jgi:hypothetical protein
MITASPTTVPSLEGLEGWDTAADRALRWWDRIQSLTARDLNDVQAQLDYYLAFFQSVHALNDYAKKLGGPVLTDSRTKKIVRDIANRSKHATIAIPSFDEHYLICREFDPTSEPAWRLVVCGCNSKEVLWTLAHDIAREIWVLRDSRRNERRIVSV